MKVFAYCFAHEQTKHADRITLDTDGQPAAYFFSDSAAFNESVKVVQAAVSPLNSHRILFCIPGNKSADF